MKSKLLSMAAIVALALTATSCSDDDEEVDFPIVGDISMSGLYNEYSHGSNGWYDTDKIGVFVTSDGKTQLNIPYAPSEASKTILSKMDDLEYYDYEGEATGDTPLKALSSVKAGFKSGDHTIYAYTPMVEGATDYEAVPLPYVAIQNKDPRHIFGPDKKYNFAYAKKSMSTYSAAVLSLGDFQTICSQITVASPEIPADAVGKKLTKVVVSCDKTIAYEEGATINLATGKISGTPLKSITYNMPNDGLEVKELWDGSASVETCHIIAFIPFAEGKPAEFTVTFTIGGKEYVNRGVAKGYMPEGANNINLHKLPNVK